MGAAATLGLVGLLLVQGEVSDAVRREWQVRAWALSPSAATEELHEALESEDWRTRHAALEALARARPGAFESDELGFVRGLLMDEQPNVRATALEVCTRFGVALPDSAHELAEDAFHEVRRQYARALAHSEVVDRRERLAALARDVDERVAWEAACNWIVSPGVAGGTDLWESGQLEHDFAAFARGVDAVVRDGDPSAVVRPARHLVQSSDLGRYVFFFATILARVGSLEVRGTSEGTPALDLEALSAEGTRALLLPSERWPLDRLWLTSFGPEASFAQREGRSRLLEAAGSLSLESALALLDRAAQADARGRDDVDAAWEATLYLEGAHAAVSGSLEQQRASALAARGLTPEGGLAWSVEFSLDFWDGLVGSAPTFEPERLRGWLAPPLPLAVRLASTEVFADTWRRTGDAGAANLLLLALADEQREVRSRALMALVGPSPGVAHLDPVLEAETFRVWREAPADLRVSDLQRFERERRFDSPWREELVRLWASGEGCVVSVPELLSKLTGDEAVIAQLADWLEWELEFLEAGEVPGVETTRGPWREAETRARWLLEAWTAASEHRAHDSARALLVRVDPLGKELVKILVASMARTRSGGQVLVESFHEGGLARRTRIEIALLVSSLERPAARALLLASYATSDEELRLRILERLGELADDEARELLLSAVLDPASRVAERVAGLDALARAGRASEVRGPLLRVFRESEDLDLRRAAIRSLGLVGDAATAEVLVGALDVDPRAEFLRDELLPAIASLQLRGEGGLSPSMLELWCAAPHGRAARELELRFRGERLPNPGFVYSDVLGAAEALAARGLLGQALPTGWEGWDARLLLDLAEVARKGGGEQGGARGLAREVNHAALIGLRGEGRAPDRDGLVLRARARLLDLALVAEDWRDVEGWAELILEDWRTGRTSPGAFRAVLGTRDARAKRAPTAWLRATRAQARSWQALARGDHEAARAEAREAARYLPASERARRQQGGLQAALAAASRR